MKHVVTGSCPSDELRPGRSPRKESSSVRPWPRGRGPVSDGRAVGGCAGLPRGEFVRRRYAHRAGSGGTQQARRPPVPFTTALALVTLLSGGLVHLNQISEARDAAVAEATRDRGGRAYRVPNGRAALAFDALYGRAGAALNQFRGLRHQMTALDTDTPGRRRHGDPRTGRDPAAGRRHQGRGPLAVHRSRDRDGRLRDGNICTCFWYVRGVQRVATPRGGQSPLWPAEHGGPAHPRG